MAWVSANKNHAVPRDYPFLDMRYPCPIKYKGRIFPSAENAYQSTRFSDPAVIEKFRYMLPDTAAYKGSAMKTTVKNWADIREEILYKILLEKFKPKGMLEKLRALDYDVIICENNRHDNDLGVCTCPACRMRGNDLAGKAMTKILMNIRARKR